VGAGGEDVPHQPQKTVDTDEEARPAEDGSSQEGSRRERPDRTARDTDKKKKKREIY